MKVETIYGRTFIPEMQIDHARTKAVADKGEEGLIFSSFWNDDFSERLATSDVIIESCPVAAQFSGRKPLALAIFRIVLVVMRKAQIA